MPSLNDRTKNDQALILLAGGLSYGEIGARLKVSAYRARQLVIGAVTERGV